MDKLYIGIDIGLSKGKGTIIAINDLKKLSFNRSDHPDGHIVERLIAFRNDIKEFIDNLVGDLHICIEKPPYHMQGNALNLIPLYFYILEAIDPWSSCCTVYEIAPKELKKFVTSKGNANKIQMVQAVQRHWGANIEYGELSEDEADAMSLSMMAYCLDDPIAGWTQYQIDVVKAISAYGI